MDKLLYVLILGGVSGFSGLLGGILCFLRPFAKRTLGIVMAFGSGALIASLSFGLMEEGFRHGGIDSTAIGLISGAGSYYLLHQLFLRHPGPKGIHLRDPATQSGMKILLASILDGLPEQFAIGVGVRAGSNLGFLVMLGSFISGIPEAVAGSAHLATSWGRLRVNIFWVVMGVISTLVSLGGYMLAGVIPGDFLGFLLAFAAGSVLAMLADTMLPEAMANGGSIISLATVGGFLLSYVVSRL